MDGRTTTEGVRLIGLIEILMKDCQQFYLNALPGSRGNTRELHEKNAHCYAVMLAEIRQWLARDSDHANTAADMPPRAPAAQPAGSDAPTTHASDDFFALLQRLDRIHDGLFPVTRHPMPTWVSARFEDASVFSDPDPRADSRDVPCPEHGESG